MVVQEIYLEKQGLTYSFQPFSHRFGPKKVNLLIGPNNSGKSRLLRAVVSSIAKQYYVLATSANRHYWHFLPFFLEPLHSKNFPSHDNGRVHELRKQILANPLPTLVGTRYTNVNRISQLIASFNDKNNESLKQLERQEPQITTALDSAIPSPPERLNILYTPTLRGFRSPPDRKKFFAEHAQIEYFAQLNHGNFRIDCGGDSYDKLRLLLLGDKQARKSVADFEKFLSEQFFEGKSVTLIPNESKKQIFVTIGKEKEQAISEIGEGLQHIITILFPVFTDRTPTFQIVEETELFLHPGFQTRLIDCYFKQEFEHVQVLAATHSNHLLNLTLDRESISIFRINKSLTSDDDEQLPAFSVRFINGNEREALSDIGVQRASLLLSNCVIFVEGPTDRRYFQRFVELYAESKGLRAPIVDLHYSFLEYGGANLKSYNFLGDEDAIDPQRLIGHEFIVIIDTDEGEAKARRRERLKEQLGKNSNASTQLRLRIC